MFACSGPTDARASDSACTAVDGFQWRIEVEHDIVHSFRIFEVERQGSGQRSGSQGSGEREGNEFGFHGR
jgi:hypothetical protein